MNAIYQQASSTEDYLELGLRDQWYPVLASWEVNANPVGITRLGENIVVWRDHDGQLHALEDRCPHRGARLSLGWNLGNRVASWYHGVEVNGKGMVEDVPAVHECPLKGAECVKSYPVIEKHDAIFIWFGLDPNEPPAELAFPEQLASEEWSSFLCQADWKVNHQYAIDNVMDPMHGTYLHCTSHSMAEGERTAEMKHRNTEHGFIFEKEGQTGVNFDWVEYGQTGTTGYVYRSRIAKNLVRVECSGLSALPRLSMPIIRACFLALPSGVWSATPRMAVLVSQSS